MMIALVRVLRSFERRATTLSSHSCAESQTENSTDLKVPYLTLGLSMEHG